MRIEISKDLVSRILEAMYLSVFAVYAGWFFLSTTTFEIVWPDTFEKDLQMLLLLVIILKTGFGGNYTKKDIVLIAVLGAVFFLSINRNGTQTLFPLFLMIIGAKGISFKRIAKVYLAVTVLLLLITIASALTGRIENLIYLQEGRRTRISFGIVYPTDFSAHVFYSILTYIYIRGKAIKYIELGLIALAGIAVYWFCDARLNTVCILMTACIFFYNKWRNRKEYQMNRMWSGLLALSPVICASFMIIFATLYTSHFKLMEILDRVLNYRFSQGNKAINVFGFTMWGQYIPMQGYGSTTEMPKHYFFLDSSYLMIVMQYGLPVLGCILLIWICISYGARMRKDWILLWCVSIISVQCMVEHHMLDIAYNPFLWALLADMSAKQGWGSAGVKAMLSKVSGRVRNGQ